jgi:hypothetical protein
LPQTQPIPYNSRPTNACHPCVSPTGTLPR